MVIKDLCDIANGFRIGDQAPWPFVRRAAKLKRMPQATSSLMLT
jgi:hypothetical protein